MNRPEGLARHPKAATTYVTSLTEIQLARQVRQRVADALSHAYVSTDESAGEDNAPEAFFQELEAINLVQEAPVRRETSSNTGSN